MEACVAETTWSRCPLVWVVSHSFQAPGRYERCGFEWVAELANWPLEHAHTTVRRYLPETTTGITIQYAERG